MTEIKDRIKELRRVPASELIPHPMNWRQHPQAQTDALTGMLAEIGFADAVIARETSEGLQLIDGHLRQDIMGDQEIPVLIVDLTEDEANKMLITLDPLAGLAETNDDMLRSLMESVQFEDERVNTLLQQLAPAPIRPVQEDPGPQIDRAVELQAKWGTERGQIWEIGRHRLQVSDFRVAHAKNADLICTSPPYAVGKEYEAGISFQEHLTMLDDLAQSGLAVLKPGGFFVINFGEIAAQSHTKPLTGSDRQCLYPISADYWDIFHRLKKYDLYAQRIWYKPFNRLQQPFWTYHTSIPHHQEWEYVWTWRAPGGAGDVVFDWNISSRAVWDTRNEATEDFPLTRHVAAFPVGIPERIIQAHSGPEMIIWEPFCGSGTTIVACERLDRICYAAEIEPKYVAVTLERMAGMGLEPRLAS